MNDYVDATRCLSLHSGFAIAWPRRGGLVTEGRRRSKRPYLVYLFAEPTQLAGRPIDDASRRRHRTEIDRFAAAVDGAEVAFGAISYREWLDTWSASDVELVGHRTAILSQFRP